MPKQLIWLLFVLAAGTSVQAAPKQAEKGPSKPSSGPARKPASLDLPRLAKGLESGTESEIRSTLAEIRQLGTNGRAAAPLVNALLGRGASITVVVDALGTAGALGAESSSDAVAPYVQHRKAVIRIAASAALALTKGPTAVAALRSALGSADPALRASAALGLGTLGAVEAVNDLFTVLAHDASEAAVSIAMLCAPAECDRLMALVGKLKFATLEPAFLPLLLRPASAVPDGNKLRYVDVLRRLATERATRILNSVQRELKEDASPALKSAVDAALRGRPATKEAQP